MISLLPPGLLADHLLESTAFAALMAVLTLCFTNNRAAVRHGLWFAASAKFLIPFSAMVAAGKYLRWETAPAVTLDMSGFALPGMVSDAMPGLTQAAPVAEAALAPVTAAARQAASGLDLESVLLTVWLTGAALLLCRWTVQWLRLAAVRRASTPAPIDAAIPVRFSKMLFEPGLVGIFRPILLLPEGITAQLSQEQLALVIEHELCHWRRRDNLTAAIHMAAQLVFWFHPLVWWIGARLMAERERACDECVLALCSNPKAYADSILEVCRFYVRSPLACAPGVAGANLKHRVERIMQNVTSMTLSFPKFLLLVGVALAALVLPMATGLLSLSAAAALPQAAPKAVARGPAMLTPPPSKLLPARLPLRKIKPVQLAALTDKGAAVSAAILEGAPAAAPDAADMVFAPEAPREVLIAADTPLPSYGPARLAPPPSAPMEELVVTGKQIREFVRLRNFVRSYTAPSEFLDQISRWQTPLCIKTVGLAPAYNAFITARLKEIGAQIGAPAIKSDDCRLNMEVIFADQPQHILDYIRAKRPDLLGTHYPALRKKVATVTHPIQAWYATGTRDSRGVMSLDNFDDWWGLDLDDYVGNWYNVPGSRLMTGLTSEFASVVVVADKAKIGDWEVGTIADYVAMTAFARAKTPDKCQQVPSIGNALEKCSDGLKAKTLSVYDLAYLKALYSIRSDAPRNLQESEIATTMRKILEKQVAVK